MEQVNTEGLITVGQLIEMLKEFPPDSKVEQLESSGFTFYHEYNVHPRLSRDYEDENGNPLVRL